MEEIEKWYEMAAELMPENLKDYVDLVLSPRVEDCYSIFRGVRYKDVPDRPYDFVFVDGPNFEAPSDGHKTFDIDLIDVVKKSSKPVYAIVDNRLATCFVFQKVFGLEKAKYPAHTRLGFIGPCTKDDLKVVESKQCFSESLRVFGNSELDLKMR